MPFTLPALIVPIIIFFVYWLFDSTFTWQFHIEMVKAMSCSDLEVLVIVCQFYKFIYFLAIINLLPQLHNMLTLYTYTKN